jgi:acetolactate decarboxylase
MNKMKKIIFLLLGLGLMPAMYAQTNPVQYKGSMQEMQKANGLTAAIMVDTLIQKNLYALGPAEFMQGEIIVWDGMPLVAAVNENKEPYLKKNVHPLKAIFLVYANIPKWDTVNIINPISSLQALQAAVAYQAALNGIDTSEAFPFLIFGKMKSGKGHIMYAEPTTTNMADMKNANYPQITHEQYAQLLGFYSQHHQNIFTHIKSYIHVHYRLGNKYQAGHLDEVVFDETAPIQLLIPHINKP